MHAIGMMKVNKMILLTAIALVATFFVPQMQAEEKATIHSAVAGDRPGFSEVRISAKGPVLEKVLQYFRDKGPTVGKVEVLCRNKKGEWFVYYTFDLALLQGADDTYLRGRASQIDSARQEACDQEVRMRGGNHVSGMKKAAWVEGDEDGLNRYLAAMSRMVVMLFQLDPLPNSIELYCKSRVGEEDYMFGTIYPKEVFNGTTDVYQVTKDLAEAGYKHCEIDMPLRDSI